MKNFTVEHYLDIYSTRKELQIKGITNPRKEIQDFVLQFVDILSKLPLDHEIILENDSFYDNNGNLLIKIPD